MNSVIDEIQIPSGWKKMPLKAVVERVSDIGFESLQPLSVYLDAGVVPRSSRDDNHNQLGEDLSKYQRVLPEDLVFNKLRTWQGGFGISKYEGIVSPAYIICRPKCDLIYPDFLGLLLKSSPYLSELTRISKWMPPTQFDISWEYLKNLELLIPSIEVQILIADYLKDKLNNCSEIIELRAKQIDLLKDTLSSRMNEIVLKPDKEMVPIKRLIKEERLGIWGDEEGSNDTNVFVARVADFNRNNFKLDAVETVRSIELKQFVDRKVSKGDILLERSGGGEKSPVGCAVYVSVDLPNLVCSNFVSRIKPQEKIDSKYLGYIFASLYLTDRQRPFSNQTTGIQNLDTEAFFKVKVPVRSEAEQVQIVEKCDRIIESTANSISLIEQMIKMIEKYKESQIVNSLIGNNLTELIQELSNG